METTPEAKTSVLGTQDGTTYYSAVVRLRDNALADIVRCLQEKDGFMRGGLPRIYTDSGKLIIEIPANVGKVGSIEFVSIDISIPIP